MYHAHCFRNLPAEKSLKDYEAPGKGEKILEKFSCRGYVFLKTKNSPHKAHVYFEADLAPFAWKDFRY